MPFAVLRPLGRPATVAIGVALAGVAFGIALWAIAGGLDGDALFHLARVRKLEAFDNLSLNTVNEFADGGLHPGYAFPLWHVFLALVARLAGVDPGSVMLHEPSVLAPVAFLVAYEAGVAVFRTAWAGIAALLAQVALTGLAPGDGGAYTLLSLPATAARHLLVPAVVATFFLYVTKPGWAAGLTAAAASLGLALVHPTYVVFVAVPLAGYVLARIALARTEVGRGLAGLAFVSLPAIAVAAWLAPIVQDTASHSPSAAERARGIAHYPGQVDVFSPHSFRLAPEMLGRPGAVAIAALLVVPLAALASRRRWAAYVLGGSVAMCAILLLPALFTPFSDGVSLSQSRRAAGFIPLAVAFAGGAAVLARLMRWWAVPVALAGGIALEIFYPGEFTYVLHDGVRPSPPGSRWWAVRWRSWSRRSSVGARRATTWAAVRRRRRGVRPARRDLRVRTLEHRDVRGVSPHAGRCANPGRPSRGHRCLFGRLDELLGRLSAAPVYVASARPGHVAVTPKNRPYERRDDANRFGKTGDLAIPRRYHADYVLVRRDRWRVELPTKPVYRDSRYVLYRL